ncbi:hypothetical protein Q9L58_008397, partial [Maublancomyces gigas]
MNPASSGALFPGTSALDFCTATFLRRRTTNNIAPTINSAHNPITIPTISPVVVPLTAAGGLDCCGAGAEVSAAGPGGVILGTLEISPAVLVELLVAVVIVELLVVVVVVTPWIVTGVELLPQEVFRKTTLPE